MQHCDQERLCLASLGLENLTTAEQGHVDHCPHCRAELLALTDTATTARSARSVEIVPPPPDVWRHIAAATGPAPASDGPDAVPPPGPSGGTVVALPRRRGSRRNWLPMAAAAVFGAVVGGSAVLGVVAGQQPSAPVADSGPVTTVVSTADLGPLPVGGRETSGRGTVDLEKVGDSWALGLSTVGLEETSGYYEVWLIDPKTMDMISVGSIDSGDHVAVLAIPDKVDLDKYSLVDISDEPLNGDPTHSSVSVLRGTLAI